MKFPDLFALKSLEREPTGPVTRDSLNRRPSRQTPIEFLAAKFGASGPYGLREKLVRLLELAFERLGPPGPDSTFADPRFMAQYQLNLLDPSNWAERDVTDRNGHAQRVTYYVSPVSEAEHLAALSADMAKRTTSTAIQSALLVAIDTPTRSSLDLARRGVVWAQEEQTVLPHDTHETEADDDDRDDFLKAEGIRAAALLVFRDGDEELRRMHGAWAEGILLEALKASDDVAHQMRGGLKFNPVATAFVGLAELYRREPKEARLRCLLEIGTRQSPAGAHGFAAAISVLADLDARLLKAVLRCGLTACVKPDRQWGLGDAETLRRAKAYAEQTAEAVAHELAWLKAAAPEPSWPNFDVEGRPSRRRRPYQPGRRGRPARFSRAGA